ncbi:MAG: ATP synthase F1 subunit delta [Pseudomonadota bacterium]
MALDATVARRYARAFAGLVEEDGAHEAVAADLARLAALLEQPGSEFLTILSNPVFTLTERQQAMKAAIEPLGFHPLLVGLLNLLLVKGRFAWLPQVMVAWRELDDAQAGRLRAVCTAARPLAPALLEEVRQRLSEATGAEVILGTHTDPSLLAGLVVEIGGVVYDASLRSRLAELQHALLTNHALDSHEA